MNNITITHELCAEDRARLDRLSTALEALQQPNVPEVHPDQLQMRLDGVMAKASEPTEAPKNAPESTEVSTLPTTQPEEEMPVAEEDAQAEEAPKPTITQAQLQQRITQLAAANGGAKKAQIRDIVKAYAKMVSEIPEDKYEEVWEKLNALESEA